MAYTPLNLTNGTRFTAEHLAHFEDGINAANETAANTAAGAVDVTETSEGVWQIGEGGQVLGLTTGQVLPAAAKTDLEATFPTKLAIQEAGYLTSVPFANPQPGEYTIDANTIRGLATDGTLPDLAKTNVADDVETPSTTIGGAIGRVVDAVRNALTPRNGKRPVGQGELFVSVRDYGATGDGTTDDTAAIEAAYKVAHDSGRALFVPDGSYAYNGPGLGGINPSIKGAGRERTKFLLGSSSRLFDTTGTIGSLDFSDFSTIGGLGLFRSTNTGNNVAGLYRVTNVHMKGYTAAAIENNANDMPYWKFRDLLFDGANFTSTIGIALSGLTDGCAIENCEFIRNRVHLKIRYGANNAYVRNCDFIRWGAPEGFPRIDVWVVPRATSSNSGAGFNLSACKFGAENVGVDDKRIVYADEGAGATNGEKFPVLDAASTGFIVGHNIRGIMVANVTGGNPAPVFSTTPNVRDCVYADINIPGTTPEYLVQFLTPPAADRLTANSVIGPVTGFGLAVDGAPAPQATNAVGFAHLIDPQGLLSASPGAVSEYTSGNPVGYKSLARTPTNAYLALGNVTLTNTPDVLGGNDARLITHTGGGSGWLQVSIPDSIATINAGSPAWIEFDAKAGDMTAVRARIQQSSGTAFHFSRVIRLGGGWHRYRFQWTPRAITGSTHFVVEPLHTNGGTFSVGRVRVYHAQEPLNVDGLLVLGGKVVQLGITADGALTTTTF